MKVTDVKTKKHVQVVEGQSEGAVAQALKESIAESRPAAQALMESTEPPVEILDAGQVSKEPAKFLSETLDKSMSGVMAIAGAVSGADVVAKSESDTDDGSISELDSIMETPEFSAHPFPSFAQITLDHDTEVDGVSILPSYNGLEVINSALARFNASLGR